MTTDLIEQFRVQYQEYHRITPHRAHWQLHHLRALESRLNGRSLVECNGDDFAAYLAELAVTRKPNTVRKIGNYIRPFFNWAYARGQLDADLYRQLREVRDPRGATRQCKPNPYSRKELEAFRVALAERLPLLPSPGKRSQLLRRWIVGRTSFVRIRRHAMRLQVEAMVALALHCGLRRGELFALLPDDLHYDNEYVVVTGKADPNTGEPKVRTVPYTEPAREAVKRWLDFRELMRPDHGKTWLTCHGRDTYAEPMSERQLKELLPVGWTWHRFRHTFATERLRAGTPLEIVSVVMGHSTLEQTRAYAEIVRQDVTRELAKTEREFVEAVLTAKEEAA
jgi:integrase